MASSESDEESDRNVSATTLWRRRGKGRHRFKYDPELRNIAVHRPDPDGHAGPVLIQQNPPNAGSSGVDPENPEGRETAQSSVEPADADLASLIEANQSTVVSHESLQNIDNVRDPDHSSDSEWSDHLDIYHSDGDEGADVGDGAGYERPLLPTEIIGDEVDFVAREDDEQPEDVDTNFDFNLPSMDEPLNMNINRTVKEALVLDLALMIRHKWTYESLIDHFKAKNVLFGKKYFPTSKGELWKVLGRNKAGIVVHCYCDCSYYLGRKRNLPAHIKCLGCKRNVDVSKTKEFVTLSLRKQLQAFLSDREVQKHFKKSRRSAADGDTNSDVFDGTLYKDNHESWDEYDGTFVENTDGCKIGKNAKTTIYPFFIRINELPPHLRQKYVFLAGIFCCKGEPCMTAFLKPIVEELNSLARDGVKWYDFEDNVERVSKFRFHCFCVDGKARHQILNMSSHSSYFGCTSCFIQGVCINKTMRYPAGAHEKLPPYEDRSHSAMMLDMKKAAREGQPVRGHHKYTPLVLLDNVDLVKQGGFDDLHFLYECAAATHLDLLLTVAPRLKDSTGTKELSYAAVERTLNERLLTIKTPSKISRKPANMKIQNKKQFTGTELRNILIYYGVPLFQDLVEDTHLDHFGMLSHIAFLLAQESISQEELKTAEILINRYLELFDILYGIERTRLNLHSLKHAVKSVQELGPLWCYTTFNFESWNNKLLTTITSPQSPVLQIITRHLLHLHLEFTLSNNQAEISEDVKEQVRTILKKKRRAEALLVEDGVYVLGSGSLRVPSLDEVNALSLKSLGTEMIMCYNKALVHGAEYQTKTSTSSNSLSDNSLVYTKQKQFCSIECVVTFKTQNGSSVCGLFVKQHVVLYPPPFESACHIQQLLPREEEGVSFILISSIKSPVVQVFVKDKVYFIPMANVLDID